MNINIRDLIGVPYKVHGRGLDGLDCYGVVIEIYRMLGIKIPDYFYDDINPETMKKLFTNGECDYRLNVKKIEQPKMWCIVYFKLPKNNHLGVYVGEGKVIHSDQTFGVHISDIRNFKNVIEGFYEYI